MSVINVENDDVEDALVDSRILKAKNNGCR